MSERPVDELEQLKSAFDELDSAYVDLQQQNKKYREALERITQYGDVFSWQASEARKALEGER